MKSKRTLPLLLAVVVMLLAGIVLIAGAQEELTPLEQLGRSIFFDENLSANQNQSCASCHGLEVGFTGPESDINAHGSVYEGSVTGLFGNRKPPSAAYATLSPILYNDKGTWIGGNFWDGRATGEKLGNPAADQAQGPFLNPVEQALPSGDIVVDRVCNPSDPTAYPVSFEEVWGAGACDNYAQAYDQIALSIAAYEASSEVNAFSSKYDRTFDGKVKLSKQEQRGYALFRGKGMCNRCHPGNGQEALFTDFTFDNLGVPKNPENPVYNVDPDFIDLGLGGFLDNEAELGKQKVPTLRNVDKRPYEDFEKAYMHNGYFKTLEGVVNFYNTRDVKPVCPGPYTEAEALAANCWPAPEFAENINTDELGDLGLTPAEEEAIVAFLKALSDGYVP